MSEGYYQRELECQVCDEPFRYRTQAQKEKLMLTWYLHTFNGIREEKETFDVLTCPKCSELDKILILKCYLDRIALGRDPKFH